MTRDLGAGTTIALAAILAVAAAWASSATFHRMASAPSQPVVIVDLDGIIAGQAEADVTQIDVVIERVMTEVQRLSRAGYLVLDGKAVVSFPADGSVAVLGYEDFRR